MEFLTIVKLSGLPEYFVKAVCGDFMDKYNRFPHLDEIPHVDSSKYLSELLELKNGAATQEKIKEITGTEDMLSAQISLNQTYLDLEVHITPIGETAKVEIKHRPVERKIEPDWHLSTASSAVMFDKIITKLTELYGIKINSVTSSDILNNVELQNIPGAATAKAFIYKGDIYVNTDFADKDAPIHEMMHILIGDLRVSGKELYKEVLEFVTDDYYFEEYKNKYPNRTQLDVAEEAFVEEFSKFVVGMPSAFSNMDAVNLHHIMYHMARILNTILNGESGINIRSEEVFKSTLKQLCAQVNSKLDVARFHTSLDNSIITHTLANRKQELMESDELREDCNG